jgi:hypothetical protein
MTVKHIVIWKVAATDENEKAAAIARIQGLLTSLVGQIDTIQSLTVGVNGIWPEKNADVTLVADFADFEGLETYQNDPRHLEAAGEIRALVSERTSIDYEY